MEKKMKWQDIVNSNYYVGAKKTAAVKTDGSPYYGKAQLYLPAGTWIDKYHARMEGLVIDENNKRQIPKVRGGYSTVYKVVKPAKTAPKKAGLKELLTQLQRATGKKGAGKTEAVKAQSLLKAIKKDLNENEGIALNHYLSCFYSVIITEDKKVPLEAVQKAVKVGYGIVTATAEKKGGKK